VFQVFRGFTVLSVFFLFSVDHLIKKNSFVCARVDLEHLEQLALNAGFAVVLTWNMPWNIPGTPGTNFKIPHF
jgi:hypothetical protein